MARKPAVDDGLCGEGWEAFLDVPPRSDKRERSRSTPMHAHSSTSTAMRGRKQLMRQGHAFQT